MALFSMGDFFILSEICVLNSRKTQDLVNGNSRNELCQRSNELWNTRKMFFRNEIKKMKLFNDEFQMLSLLFKFYKNFTFSDVVVE